MIIIALTIIAVTAMVLWAIDRWRRPLQNLQERRVQLEEQKQAPSPPAEKPEPIPTILLIMAQSESEEWAREDSIKAFHEAHQKLDSWQPVAGRAIANALRGEVWDINRS